MPQNADLAPDPLRVVFQPIFALDPVRIIGFEALGRSVEDVGPRTLLERAHREGWLLELEHGWRRRAIEAIARSPFAHTTTFFLNVDTRIVHDRAFRPGFTQALLAEHGIDPGRIVFELTEHDPDLRGPGLRVLLRHYAAQGFRMALDDLGAGHASLAALVELEPAIVKLDRAIVAGIWRSPLRSRLVRALVRFTDESGIDLIAEGIDSAADLALLRELGVRFGQGFLLAEPRPLESWRGPELSWCKPRPQRRGRASAFVSRTR